MYIRTIFFLMLLIPLSNYAIGSNLQVTSYYFRHLTLENGLSHADANVVVQDKRGFIWIGTYSGLNRYDGYEIQTYYNELSYINKPYLNRVHDISVDDDGLFWLATAAGVQLFDPNKKTYIPIRVEEKVYQEEEYELEKILSIGKDYLFVKTNKDRVILYKISDDYTLKQELFHIDAHCYSLYKDKMQRVWISTNKGLYVLNNNNVLACLQLPLKEGKNVSIRFSFVNQNNHLLVATEQNLYFFNQNVDIFFESGNTVLEDGIPLPIDLSEGWITDIVQDLRGNYWVSSLKGLYHIRENNGYFVANSILVKSETNNLTSDFISRLLLDGSGNLFISTYGGGVNIFDLNQPPFSLIRKKSFETNTLSENLVRSITECDNYLWIGTNSMGLNCLSKQNGEFSYYNTALPFPKHLRSNGIRALLNDNEGTLWVGHTNGIDFINLNTHAIELKPEIEKVHLGEISALVKDCFGQIWVGTWNNGIARIRKKENGQYETVLLKKTQPDYPAFTPSRIITVYADSVRPEIFYSSGKQLTHLFLDQNGDVEKSLIYQANDAKQNSLSSNFVCSIARENDTILWVGCIGGGLNRMCLLPDGDYRSKVFSLREGLNQVDIESLQIDENGNIWLGTNGLIKYVPSKNEFNVFRTINGDFVNSFKVGSSYRGQDGWMYFCGTKGVVCFRPTTIKKNELEAKAEISYVTVNSQRLPYVDKLVLPYNKNNVSLHFTSLHYAAPEKCRFRYRLIPLEKEWRLSENGDNSVNYANLPYGNYQFELIASNNDGVWGKSIRTLSVSVIPPWWQSWYAKLTYLCLIVIFFVLVYFYLLRWLTLEKQLEIKQLKEEQSERIHQMQLQFFTNISHEFRTPLTLILGTIEKISLSQDWKVSYEEVLNRNIKRLMDLVDDLLDFREVKTEGFKLAVCEQSVCSFFGKIIDDFNLLANTKNINFRAQMPVTDRLVWFDPKIMEKIVLNILNNAFKYTKEGGTIDFIVDDSLSTSAFQYTCTIESETVSDNNIHIYIKDSGVGISGESIEKIFTRYYRIHDSDYDPHIGSGVGLALVKSLLILHKGNLHLSSERGKGTDVLLTIPCDRKNYTDDEICPANDAILQDLPIIKEKTLPALEKKETIETRQTLLLVEDNDEVRDFLADSLSLSYHIWQATDGQEALSVLKQQIPDLIISDLMMPNMDGSELCRIVKNKKEYHCIPFVMLTAKVSLEAQIKGADAGADAYLAKPVSIQLLTSVIRNLLNQKKRVKEELSSTYLRDVLDETIQIKDKKFCDTLFQVIMLNLSNPDLDASLLAQEMGYSRTRLYQKVKEITDRPVMELVRQFRLRRAIQIMAEENLSISEIIPKIGIMSQSYFTNAFKKEYGTTPSRYMKEMKKNKETEN